MSAPEKIVDYSEPYLVHIIAQVDDSRPIAYEYTETTHYDCLDCGAAVSDREQHTKFHERLRTQACRG